MSDDLPIGWCSAEVADLARCGEQPVLTGPFGTNLGREDFAADGVPVLTIGCLTDGGVDLRRANYVTEEKAVALARYRLRGRDLLFSRMASVGRANVVPDALTGALFNYHIMRLRLDARAYVPELFIQYVRGSSIVAAYLDEVNHGATRDGINTSQLLAMPVHVPPRPEQRRIVAKLDALTERSRRAKAALDAIPALIEKFKQSVLAAAFRGDLTADWRAAHPDVEPASELLARIRVERRRRWEEAELAKLTAKGKAPTDDRWKAKYEEPKPVDASELPELPRGWCYATIETVGDVHLGQQRAPQYLTGRYTRPYLRVANIKEDRIKFEDINEMDFGPGDFEHFRLLAGDILLSEGQSPDLVGESAIYAGGIEGLCFQKTLHRFRRYGSAPTPEYAQLVFRHCRRSGVFRAHASLTTNIAHLTLVRLKQIPFPLAPEGEQREIVRRVSSAFARIASAIPATTSGSIELARLDRSILAKAFRGELVPQDPSDEPASVLLERIRAERAAADSADGAANSKPGRRRRAASA